MQANKKTVLPPSKFERVPRLKVDTSIHVAEQPRESLPVQLRQQIRLKPHTRDGIATGFVGLADTYPHFKSPPHHLT
jgi:hypothetical protein